MQNENNQNPQNPPFMLNLSAIQEKIKYKSSIKQAVNGFAVFVEQDIQPSKPVTRKDAVKMVTGFTQDLNEKYESGLDPVMDKIKKQIEQEEQEEKPEIIGLHVFKTFSEMTAFLSFIYEENDK